MTELAADELLFFALLSFVIFLWLMLNRNSMKKKKSNSSQRFQAQIDEFLENNQFQMDPSKDDSELLGILKPLREIGENYPPAIDTHSRIFNKLRIAREVIVNFDELALSLGIAVAEPLDGIAIGKINNFIDKHINFVGDVYTHNDVQAIVWEMFDEVRKQNPEYEPEPSESFISDDQQIGSAQKNADSVDFQVIDDETGEVTEVSINLPEFSVVSSDTEDDPGDENFTDDNHDEYLGYIQETDFWDDDLPNVEFWRRRVDLRLEFDYPSSNGKINRRTVDASLYGNIDSSSILLKGHCLDKDATRHFKVEKIRNCVDLDKDEQISDVRLYLDETYNASIHRTLDLLRDEKNDLVTGLLYVARVGGNLTKTKRAAIGDALFWYCEDKRFKEHNLQHFLATFFDTPSTVGFQRLIGRIKRSDDQRMILAMVNGTEGIVKSIKKVKASELEALEYVKSKLC
ncbi:hypothetical protein N9X88_05395 [Alphaproteobacteria bacterium]|nr:hypothetical protein [Alphaproteobacteria bacterium]